MWRRFRLARNTLAFFFSPVKHTRLCHASIYDTLCEFWGAPDACKPRYAPPFPPHALPHTSCSDPVALTPETLMTHSGGSNILAILRRPPTAARPCHRAYKLSSPESSTFLSSIPALAGPSDSLALAYSGPRIADTKRQALRCLASST
ncbi:hypothetical protein BD626DRAFT_226171 [Schizophyllum amplum]|uniref:Uncharacterized protein n=1 Tax=Schizophyllum amplum TaxID=97359 RepID=A0A550BWP4_9AGAR|nr:hypothetical protein BD626DRAFT_226171 [Auriculariopsis ampla]